MYVKKTLCLVLLVLTASGAWAEEKEAFLAKLKNHYQDTLSIEKFSLKLHFLNKRYRDYNYWDYRYPNRFMSQRLVEADLQNKHFYDNDILYFSGGRLFDRVQFQNDKESYYYEKSGTSLGKGIIDRGMENFGRFKRHIVMNIDFLAVRPLIEETDIDGKITLEQNDKEQAVTLHHRVADEQIVSYQFSDQPLRLKSVNHRPMQGIFIYDDYLSSRGLIFAHSVTKYYDGETGPTYISYNDQFTVIDKVDPDKLRLPDGYGPVLKRGDGVLVTKEIGVNLFLVTDSSAVTNSLLKVNGDKISLFGASAGERIANKTLAFIQEHFPDKKLASVYVTHPHSHQIAGLNVFAEKGAEIIADEYTISGIKAYPKFANEIANFKFRMIEHKDVIDGAQFYVLENMHAKRQSFVHFEDSGVIFQSHFLHVPLDNTIPKVLPTYSKKFIDFIRSENLTFDRIVGNYRNNNISVEMVNQMYNVHM